MVKMYKKIKKPAKCMVCEKVLENGNLVYEIPNATKNANGGKGYVCADHARTADYHDREVKAFCHPRNFRGKLKKDGLLYAIELEVCERRDYPIWVDGVLIEDAQQALAYIASVWQLRWTHDCTVGAEGNMPPETTMSGWRDRLARTLRVLAPNNSDAGAHLTIGFAIDRENIPNFDRWNAERCLSYLANHVLLNATNMDLNFVFGRSFTEYSEYTDWNFSHGYWANIRDNGSIEFRICHIDCITQYMRAATFCAEFCKIVKLVDNGLAISKAFRKIETLWKKTVQQEMAVDNRSKYGDKIDRARVEK